MWKLSGRLSSIRFSLVRFNDTIMPTPFTRHASVTYDVLFGVLFCDRQPGG